MLPLVFVAESLSFAQPYSVEESENQIGCLPSTDFIAGMGRL